MWNVPSSGFWRRRRSKDVRKKEREKNEHLINHYQLGCKNTHIKWIGGQPRIDER